MIIEAIKKIYPTIDGGFMYWKTKQDLTPWANPIDGLIWENKQFEKPTWDQIKFFLDIIILDQAKLDKINQIKTKAKFLIEQIYPLYKQLNYLADVAFIQNKQLNNQELSENEIIFLEEAKEVRSFIKSIRDNSNELETQIKNCLTLEDINNINFS